MKTATYDLLSTEDKTLVDAASEAKERAYNPYSHFFVGAALRTNGPIITGANIENASYGLVLCAERVALTRAYMAGIREFTKIAIVACSGNRKKIIPPTAPCGACRQWLHEFSCIAGNDLEVIMASSDKKSIRILTTGELLPYAFEPKNLGKNVAKYGQKPNARKI